MPGHPDIQEMEISEDGIELIKEFESFFPDAYLDPVGVPTIGWGHTAGVELGQHVTREGAEQFLHDDLRESEMYLKRVIKVPLTQHQFDACTSIIFNMGIGNFLNKTEIPKLINRSQYSAACAQFSRHTTAKGEEFDGLVRRRAAEMALFNLPDHVPSDKSPINPPLPKGEGGVRPDIPQTKPGALQEIVTQSSTVKSLLTAVSGLIGVVATLLEPLKKNPGAAIALGLAAAGIGAAFIFKLRDAKAGR